MKAVFPWRAENRPHLAGAAERGMTLTEVVIVSALMSVLIILCLSGIPQINKSVKTAKCVNNMRQLGAALHAYRLDHNGWFPPGKPTKTLSPSFETELVPKYLGEVPVCPEFRLTPEGRKRFPNEKAKLRSYSGGYGIHGVLLQWRFEALPWGKWPVTKPFMASKVPFIMETGGGSAAYSLTAHQNRALDGIPGYYTAGRSHGGNNDALNFMFLDGHVRTISRNDKRTEGEKHWARPSNPEGAFTAYGDDGTLIAPTYYSESDFDKIYPQ